MPHCNCDYEYIADTGWSPYSPSPDLREGMAQDSHQTIDFLFIAGTCMILNFLYW